MGPILNHLKAPFTSIPNPGIKIIIKKNIPKPNRIRSNFSQKSRGIEIINTKNLKKQKKQMTTDLKELSDKYSEHKKIDSNMYM